MAESDSTGSRPIITYSQARALGLARYFPGTPCKHGHVAERRSSDAMCLECLREKSRRQYREHKDAHQAALKRYRESAPPLTQTRVREVLRYDEHTGVFTWRVDRAFVQAGESARSTDNGYVRIRIDGRLVRAHRLVWLYVHGRWPDGAIDHINGDRSDNRLANLREASAAVNAQNQRTAHRNNQSTGVLGVSRHHDGWRAKVSVNGVAHFSKKVGSIEAARSAYLEMKRRLHIGSTL